MARNTITVEASPEQVFAVLEDAWSYDRWVIGARTIRAVDPGWPAPGACLHHTLGLGPLRLSDSTVVLERRANERLVLKAHARPLMVAKVTFTLSRVGTATRVVMEEGPLTLAARLTWRPALDALTHLRNDGCLKNLKALVEERISPDAR